MNFIDCFAKWCATSSMSSSKALEKGHDVEKKVIIRAAGRGVLTDWFDRQ